MAEDYLIDCCFKVGLYGSVIHDKLNTVTHKLVKYSDFIDTSVMTFDSGVVYSDKYYEGSLVDVAATNEAFMFKLPEVHFVVNVVNRWYACFTHDKARICYKDLSTEEKDTAIFFSEIFDLEDFYDVGIELTDVLNLRYPPWMYRICYKNGYIYTAKGIFKLPVPLSRLTGWRNDAKMYAKLRYQEKYFGYLFVDTGYILLYLNEDGTLGWEERSE